MHAYTLTARTTLVDGSRPILAGYVNDAVAALLAAADAAEVSRPAGNVVAFKSRLLPQDPRRAAAILADFNDGGYGWITRDGKPWAGRPATAEYSVVIPDGDVRATALARVVAGAYAPGWDGSCPLMFETDGLEAEDPAGDVWRAFTTLGARDGVAVFRNGELWPLAKIYPGADVSLVPTLHAQTLPPQDARGAC